MKLRRYRFYDKKKQGVSLWERKLYRQHNDASNIFFQKEGIVVFANFQGKDGLILNVAEEPYLDKDGFLNAHGYLEEDKPVKKEKWSPQEHWIWEPQKDE